MWLRIMAIHKWCMNFSMLLMFQSSVMKVGTKNPVKSKIIFLSMLFIPVLCRLSIYSQSQSISINFNPFQSLSIPNLNGDWDWIVNPIFWGRLGLSQSQSFTFANRWFCPIYVSEIHKKVLCQNSQMLDLSYHISSEYTFSFSCLPQWARKYRKSSYSAVFFFKRGIEIGL